MRITLLPYVSEWPVVYEYEKFLLLRGTNQPGIQIEHIGSTAIPGLPAKPVIDVMLGAPQGFPLDLLVGPSLALIIITFATTISSFPRADFLSVLRKVYHRKTEQSTSVRN